MATAKKCTMYMFSHPDCCCLRCCLSSLILWCNYLTGVTQTKLTNWITGKQQYIPRKLVRDQSGGRKKNNKLFKASNLNIDSKHFSRKQNVSPDNVFLFKTFHITPRRHIILFETCCYFVIYQQFLKCNFKCLAIRSRPQVKIITNVYIFLTTVIYSNRPLRKHTHFFSGFKRSCL